MASSLETNKILGAILTAGIFASGAGVASRILYHPTAPEEPAYVIEVAASGEEAGGADAGGEADLGTLLASADAGAGETAAKKCTTCHTFEDGGKDKVGPNLFGIVGRGIGGAAGFGYSDAMAGFGGNWDDAALDAFLAKPKDFLPGTKMAFAGIKDGEDRADLIMYLRSFSPDAPPLPEAQAPTEEASGAESEAEGTAEAAMDTATDAAEEVADSIQEGAEKAADAVQETAEAAGDAMADAADATKEAATDAAEAVADAAGDAADEAKDAATATVAAVSDAASGAADAVSGAASGLMAAIGEGDVAKGEKISKKCKACHVFDEGGKNKLGPGLWDIVGRDIGTHEGFKFSPALAAMGGAWTYEELDAFLAAPKSYVPGTKMVFAGVKKEQDRANLLAYLRTLSAEPKPLADGS